MIEVVNPECCGKKMFRSYAKQKLGPVFYIDVVYLCKKCKKEYYVTVREIDQSKVHICEEKMDLDRETEMSEILQQERQDEIEGYCDNPGCLVKDCTSSH